MARWAGELERQTEDPRGAVSGLVRVAASPGIAYDLLVPWASRLRQDLPDLRLEVLAGVEYADLARGEADLALRAREPSQPELTTLVRIEMELAVVASPAYVATLPCELKAVGDLEWVSWAAPLEHIFPRPQLEAKIDPFRPRFATNSFLVQSRALHAGLGATVAPIAARLDGGSWHPFPDAPRLSRLDVGWALPSAALYLVTAKSSRLVPRIAAAAEHLIASVRRYLDGELDSLA